MRQLFLKSGLFLLFSFEYGDISSGGTEKKMYISPFNVGVVMFFGFTAGIIVMHRIIYKKQRDNFFYPICLFICILMIILAITNGSRARPSSHNELQHVQTPLLKTASTKVPAVFPRVSKVGI